MLHKTMHVLYLGGVISALVFGMESENEGHESDPSPSTAKCPAESFTSNTFGEFIFPEATATEKGTEVRIGCPLGFRDDGFTYFEGGTPGVKDSKINNSGAMRKCFKVPNDNGQPNGQWEPNIDNIEVNYCREQTAVRSEESLLNSLETVTPNNFRQILTILNRLLLYADRDYSCASTLVNGIAYLLTTPKLHGEDGLTSDDRLRLLSIIHSYSTALTKIMPTGVKLQVGDQGITIENAKFSNSYIKSGTDKAFALKPYFTTLNSSVEGTVGITISAEALEMSMGQMQEAPKLKITVYSDDVINVWKETHPATTTTTIASTVKLPENPVPLLPSSSTPTNLDEHLTEPYQTWGLLDIELDGVIENLTAPIELKISNIDLPDGFGLSCVYWDDNGNSWSTEGVTTLFSEGDDQVICRSTHLTAFSALIEPLPLPFPDAKYAPINNSVHAYILSILSSIGSVCSIIGLGLTVLTYTLFRSLRRERSNRILLNLSSSLLLMHIMSISASRKLWDGHCFVPAASLHYLVLTSLAWMMVEAVHMFELLISVFVRPEDKFLLKRFILAWGFPLILVIIGTVVDTEVYTAGRADLCLMNAHKNIILYYAAYIAPICIMLLVNLIIFCKIFRVLYQQTKRTRGKSVNAKGMMPKYQFVKISPSQIKGATTVLVLLGIGWIFGLLAIGPFEVFFRYLYCVCNAGQGAFIFIFRVLLNPHACKQWRRVLLGFSADGSLDVSVTTSSTTGSGSGGNNKRKSTILSPSFISAANSVENSLTASNPLSNTLATTLASIIRSEDERAAACTANMNHCILDGSIKEK